MALVAAQNLFHMHVLCLEARCAVVDHVVETGCPALESSSRQV